MVSLVSFWLEGTNQQHDYLEIWRMEKQTTCILRIICQHASVYLRPRLREFRQIFEQTSVLPVQPVNTEPWKFFYSTFYTSPYKFLPLSALEWLFLSKPRN